MKPQEFDKNPVFSSSRSDQMILTNMNNSRNSISEYESSLQTPS